MLYRLFQVLWLLAIVWAIGITLLVISAATPSGEAYILFGIIAATPVIIVALVHYIVSPEPNT